jgi:hypothetical protein
MERRDRSGCNVAGLEDGPEVDSSPGVGSYRTSSAGLAVWDFCPASLCKHEKAGTPAKLGTPALKWLP